MILKKIDYEIHSRDLNILMKTFAYKFNTFMNYETNYIHANIEKKRSWIITREYFFYERKIVYVVIFQFNDGCNFKLC